MIALTCFQAKYPKLEVELNPFADLPKDEDVPMDNKVPYEDGVDPPPIPK